MPPTPRRQQAEPQPPPAALPPGTVAETLGVATGSAAAAPAVAGVVTGAVAATAVAAASATILGGFRRLFRKRQNDDILWLRVALKETYPQRTTVEIETLVDHEMELEREFQAKALQRIEEDLPKALAIADPAKRNAAVQKILAREQRYMEMREKAMAKRSKYRAELIDVKRSSPDGAYWKLDPSVKQHTLDCILMGEKFWPWEVLDKFHPQLHVGCACHLYTKKEAVSRGLMDRNYMPNVKDAIALANSIMQRAGHLHEVAEPEEIERYIELLVEEARVGPRGRQKCKYGDHPATKSLIWANGNAYIPVCGDHEQRARDRIAEQHDEVDGEQLIEAAYDETLHPRGREGKWIRKNILKALRHEIPTLPTPPLQERATGQGRHVWMRGRYVFVPRHREFKRTLDGHTFHSPSGGTNIYRNGNLVQIEGQGPPPHHHDLNPPDKPDIRNIPGSAEWHPPQEHPVMADPGTMLTMDDVKLTKVDPAFAEIRRKSDNRRIGRLVKEEFGSRRMGQQWVAYYGYSSLVREVAGSSIGASHESRRAALQKFLDYHNARVALRARHARKPEGGEKGDPGTSYTSNPDLPTTERVAAYRAAFPNHANDVNEIAATLVDEDEAKYPGTWQATGFDRGSAISEYLYEIGRMDGTTPFGGFSDPGTPTLDEHDAPGLSPEAAHAQLLAFQEHEKNTETVYGRVAQALHVMRKDVFPIGVGDYSQAARNGLYEYGFQNQGRSLSADGKLETAEFRHGPSRALLTLTIDRDRQSVVGVEWTPGKQGWDAPQPPLEHPPRNWEEFADEVRGVTMRLAHENNTEPLVSEVVHVSDRNEMDDHAGTHQTDNGRIRLGFETTDALAFYHPASNAPDAPMMRRQQPLPNPRGAFAAYKVGVHEALHGVNSIPGYEYLKPAGKALEEALTEELAHVETAKLIRQHGATELLGFARMNPNDVKVQGSYTGYRAQLDRVLNIARVAPEEREDLIRHLKFEVLPDGYSRREALAAILAENTGTDLDAAREIVRTTMERGELSASGLSDSGRFQPILRADLRDFPAADGAMVNGKFLREGAKVLIETGRREEKRDSKGRLRARWKKVQVEADVLAIHSRHAGGATYTLDVRAHDDMRVMHNVHSSSVLDVVTEADAPPSAGVSIDGPDVLIDGKRATAGATVRLKVGAMGRPGRELLVTGWAKGEVGDTVGKDYVMTVDPDRPEVSMIGQLPEDVEVVKEGPVPRVLKPGDLVTYSHAKGTSEARVLSVNTHPARTNAEAPRWSIEAVTTENSLKPDTFVLLTKERMGDFTIQQDTLATVTRLLTSRPLAPPVTLAADLGDTNLPPGYTAVTPVPSETVGLHSTGGFGLAETLLDQIHGTRQEGHYGTGLYFVSSASRLSGTTYGEGGPRRAVGLDLTGKNLYRPPDERTAFRVHDVLRDLNSLVIDDQAPEHVGDDPLLGRRYDLGTIQRDLSDLLDRQVRQQDVKEAFDAGLNDVLANRTDAPLPSTRLMQALGYDGVDVRHLSLLDNTGYGSVLYPPREIHASDPGFRSQVPNDQAVYIAEGAMERGGLDGGPLGFDVVGHANHPTEQGRAESARLTTLAQEISGDPTLRGHISNWISGPGGDVGHAVYNGSSHAITIRPGASKLTFLHEVAHAMTRTEHGVGGHDARFITTAHDLYAKHLGPEAAQTFWNLIGDRVPPPIKVRVSPGLRNEIEMLESFDLIRSEDDIRHEVGEWQNARGFEDFLRAWIDARGRLRKDGAADLSLTPDAARFFTQRILDNSMDIWADNAGAGYNALANQTYMRTARALSKKVSAAVAESERPHGAFDVPPTTMGDPGTGATAGRVFAPYDPEAIGLTRQSNDDSKSVAFERWRSTVEDATGQLVRGDPIAPDDPRIPETLYHATTDLPGVLADGYLRARGEGGLGGDRRDRIVSLTTDPKIAAQLAADLHLLGSLHQQFGPAPETTYVGDGVYDYGGRPAWGKKIRAALHAEAQRQGFAFGGEPPTRAGDNQEQIDRDLRFWQGMENSSDLGGWVGQWFSVRRSNTDKENPIIMDASAVAARINPDTVGVVTVPKASLDNGAILTDFDLSRGSGLSEVRSYGDVRLAGTPVHTEDPGTRESGWVANSPALQAEVKSLAALHHGTGKYPTDRGEVFGEAASDLRRDYPSYRYYAARDENGEMLGFMVIADPPSADERLDPSRLPYGTTLDDVVVLGRMVSTTPGTGKEMLRQAAQMAGGQGKYLVGWSLPGARAFYRSQGMHEEKQGWVTRVHFTPQEALRYAQEGTLKQTLSEALFEKLGVPEHERAGVAAGLLMLPVEERASVLDEWLTEAIDFNPHLHPHDRRGRWAQTFHHTPEMRHLIQIGDPGHVEREPNRVPSDFVTLPKSGKLAKQGKVAMDAIDSLLRIPELHGPIPVRATAGKNTRGGFMRKAEDDGYVAPKWEGPTARVSGFGKGRGIIPAKRVHEVEVGDTLMFSGGYRYPVTAIHSETKEVGFGRPPVTNVVLTLDRGEEWGERRYVEQKFKPDDAVGFDWKGDEGQKREPTPMFPTEIKVSVRDDDSTFGAEATLVHEFGHYLDNGGFADYFQFRGMATDHAAWHTVDQDTRDAARANTHAQQHPLASVYDKYEEDYPVLSGWLEAVRATPEIEGLMSASYMEAGTHKYLISPREMFARSFTQWVAIRSKDESLMAWLRDVQSQPETITKYRKEWDRIERKTVQKPYEAKRPNALLLRQWQDENFAPVATALDAVFESLGWRHDAGS